MNVLRNFIFKSFIICVVNICLIHLTSYVYAQRYNFSTYTISNGLPANYIQALKQDKSGYLWIGTMNGVCRFDGHSFKTFKDNFVLSHNPVPALFEDKMYNMWIGTTGKGLAVFDGIKFKIYTMHDGLCSNSVTAICGDKSGKIFIGTDKGISILEGNKFQSLTTKEGLPDNKIISICSGLDDDIWISTYNGLAKYNSGKIKVFNTTNGLPSNIIYTMFLSSSDTLWLSCYQNLISYDGKKFTAYPMSKSLLSDHIESIIQDHNKVIWFATDGNGFGKLKNQGNEMIDANAGLCNNSVSALIEDREGNLWLGTKNGLSKFGGNRFVIYSNSEGLSASNINKVIPGRNGTLWLGTVAGGLINFSDHKIKTYGSTEGIKSSTIWSIYNDSKNKLWVGTTDGVFCKEEGKEIFTRPFSWLNNNVVYSIAEDNSGQFYFGTDNGLYLLHKDSHELIDFKKGLTNTSVRSLFYDSRKTLWVGTLQGMFFLKEDSATRFYPKDIPNAPVTSIIEDSSHTIIFNVLDFGIYYFNINHPNKISYINSSNSNIDPAVTFVFLDNTGYMWAGNYKGVNRFNWNQFIKTGKVPVDHFEKATGYFGETSNDACSDTDGNVWIASVNGLVKFNRDAGEPVEKLPNIVINNLQLFLADVDWNKSGFKINPGTNLPDNPEFNYNQNHISFSYNAIYFTSVEEIKYSYKLEGFDKDWSPLTPYRIAYYANIGPGNYIFKVKATVNEKTWTPPVSFSFSILPPWWTHPGMIVLYVLGGIAIIMSILKIRTNSLQRSRNELAKKVSERTSELNQKNIELEKLSLVASKADNAVLIFNDKLELEYINSGFNKMTGYIIEDLIKERGVKLNALTFNKDIETIVEEALTKNKSVIYETKLLRKNGTELYASSTLTPIFNNKGELQNIVVIDTDITAAKLMEAKLKHALNERGILLKEIHHRVKNNLQIIISLLNLQSFYIQDEAAITALKEGQHRVRSMALIHERFYQSEELSKIAFDEYVTRLADSLFLSYGISQEKVRILIKSDKVSLDIDAAVPCGLIINELLSNSLKHAFTNSPLGEIRIEFREPKPGMFKLVIGDNGKGLPADFDIKKSDTLGMQLISALAEQIEGQYKFENKNGLTFTLEFSHSSNQ